MALSTSDNPSSPKQPSKPDPDEVPVDPTDPEAVEVKRDPSIIGTPDPNKPNLT